MTYRAIKSIFVAALAVCWANFAVDSASAQQFGPSADDIAVAKMSPSPMVARWGSDVSSVDRPFAGCLLVKGQIYLDWRNNEFPTLAVRNRCSFPVSISATVGHAESGTCQPVYSIKDVLIMPGDFTARDVERIFERACIAELRKLDVAPSAFMRPKTTEAAAAQIRKLATENLPLLKNVRPGAWAMVRRVNDVTPVRSCFSRFEAPTVVEKTGSVNPAAFMGIDWKDATSVSVIGNFVHFQAKWMAANETGVIELWSTRDAVRFAASIETLILRCK